MEAMTERCQEMLVLAQRQREAVVQENIGSVGEIVIEQEYAQTDFQNLEQERLALVKDLSVQLGLGDKPLTAASLLPRVPPTWSNAYRLQVEMLKKAMAAVKDNGGEVIKDKILDLNQQEFDQEVKKHQELSRTASAGMFKGGLAEAGEEVKLMNVRGQQPALTATLHLPPSEHSINDLTPR